MDDLTPEPTQEPTQGNATLQDASPTHPDAIHTPEGISPEDYLRLLRMRWPYTARPDQLAPDGDWSIWLLLGGRGSGKTRAGAEWVQAQVMSGARHVALVGPTYSDVREVMIDGESGIMSLGMASERPRLRGVPPSAGMAQRGGRAGVLIRGPGRPARAAIRLRLGGRVLRVELSRRDAREPADGVAAGAQRQGGR